MGKLFDRIGFRRKGLIPAVQDKDSLYVYVKCSRCGEIIPVRVSLKDEVQQNYDKSKDKTYQFFVRKEVAGSGYKRCFARISIYLEFDSQFRVTGADIKGGDFVSAKEYDAFAKKGEAR